MEKWDVEIIFFGTSDFAVPTLEMLVQNGYEIAGIVTRPDEPAGRKNILTPTPVKVAAERLGLIVFQPKRLDPRVFTKEIPSADLFIVAAYGKIIPQKILSLPRLGALNIHPSLLPRWRGPAPIQYAILHGDTETGVTIMEMDAQMDHGQIVVQRHTTRITRHTTYSGLHDELARQSAVLLADMLPAWIARDIHSVPQDESQATYSKILTREDGKIDWKKTADAIERMIRAFHPWPGTWTPWAHNGRSVRLRIESADWIPNMPPTSRPGLVWKDTGHPLMIATEEGSLVVKTIGAEGKNTTDADAFVRGHAHIIGAILGGVVVD
ncbi:MAG: methionyl-tRNA formyltransferase [Patescibacteria group bacterium]